MDIMPISVVVFGAIPEAILMVWAGLLLLGQKPQLKRLIIIGVLQGISAYYIRRYMDFGYHMVILTALLIIYTYFIMGVRLFAAVMAVLITCSIIIIVEGSLVIFTNANMAHVLSMGWKRIFFLLPHDIILGLIIYICLKKKVSLLTEFGVLKKFME